MTTTLPAWHATVPSEVDPESLADLAADCADVDRRIHELPRPRPGQGRRAVTVTIPDRALAVVSGLDVYGD